MTTSFTGTDVSGAEDDPLSQFLEALSGGASTNAAINWGNLTGNELSLQSLTDAVKFAQNLMGGTSQYGQAGGMMATMGLSALLNKMFGGTPQVQGYQGKVPLYSAGRQQLETPAYTPYAEYAVYKAANPPGTTPPVYAQPYRRPGQGGINYFSPIQYTDTGKEPSKAQEFLGTPVSTTAPSTTTEPAVAPPPTGYVPSEPTWPSGIPRAYAQGGGIAMLAKGGRYLRGPGDGVSDSIPAVIQGAAGGQPAKLADGEFVIPARVVAEIGNGSNEAGARKLYAMMDRVEKMAKRAQRGKPSGADKELNKLA